MFRGLKEKRNFLFWFFCFGLLLFLSFNKHAKSDRFNYHAVLWADKAGYFVFLPAASYYHFDARLFPANIAEKTGNGFALDRSSGKVMSKYPIGNALLHSPFYGLACLIDFWGGNKEALGFTKTQHRFLIISHCFFESLALLMLLVMLSKHYTSIRCFLLLFFMLFSSNVFWYFTRDVGLSHSSSFFVFTGLLFLLQKEQKSGVLWLFGLVFLSALALVLRPINLFALILLLLTYGIDRFSDLLDLLREKFWILLALLPLALFPLLLQCLYYQYAYGSWISYSYGNEGFPFLFNPQFLSLFFAFGNGLFPYNTPLLFVALSFPFYWKKHGKKHWPALALFFLTSYIYAAWWSVGLGCGFGHRGFVEFMPIFLFPFASFFDALGRNKQWIFSTLFFLHAVFLLKISYAYDGCWQGNNIWEWAEWWRLMVG